LLDVATEYTKRAGLDRVARLTLEKMITARLNELSTTLGHSERGRGQIRVVA
jgi:hypothetical protein